MTNKLFLFDCDDTIWNSRGDYISSLDSHFDLLKPNRLLRVSDKKEFVLGPGVRELFSTITLSGSAVGIISDNKPHPVELALKSFGLWSYIEPHAFNVRLWKGYCPKDVMVEEVLRKREFLGFSKNNVFWVDDKDYNKEAAKIGVNFIRVLGSDAVARVMQEIL